MQPQEFFTRVADEANLADSDAARRISLATIECICIHLPAEQTRQLASQLATDLAKAAEAGAEQAQPGQQVALDDFYIMVAQRADMAAEDVGESVRVAARVFKQALSQGESVDVVMDAPPELDGLLTG